MLNLEDKAWKTCYCGGSVEAWIAGCPIHDHTMDDAVKSPDEEVEKVWAYDTLYIKDDGTMEVLELDGVSAAHAWEEALHECPGQVIAVRRGDDRGYTTG